MAVLLMYQQTGPNEGIVTTRHYKPEKLTDEQRAKGFYIETEAQIPKPPDVQRGQDARLMVNTKTMTLFWNVVDRPKTNDEIMEELVERLDDMITGQKELIGLLKAEKEAK